MTQSADPLPGLGLTAILVASARATESARPDRLFDDPLARAFVEAASAAAPAIAQALAQGSPDEGVNQARRNSVAVRTRFCDDYLLAAARSGCRQVVLLAAGLDARAFRLPWPEGVRLWELDTPEVFAFKERVLADRGAKPGCERTVVPGDLREDWPHTLSDADFNPGRPTAWLIEGLLMYLNEGERDLVLDRVGALSSAGSRIALDHSPGFFSPPAVTSTDDPSGDRAAACFAALAAAASSDPSLIAPKEWLGGHGWRAEVEEPAAILARRGRPVPAQLQPAAAGAARRWIATAERVSSARASARRAAKSPGDASRNAEQGSQEHHVPGSARAVDPDVIDLDRWAALSLAGRALRVTAPQTPFDPTDRIVGDGTRTSRSG